MDKETKAQDTQQGPTVPKLDKPPPSLRQCKHKGRTHPEGALLKCALMAGHSGTCTTSYGLPVPGVPR